MQLADREDAIGEAMLAAVVAEKKLDGVRAWQPYFAVAIDRRLRKWWHARRMIRSGYGRCHEPRPRVTALGDHDPSFEDNPSEPDSFPLLIELVRCLKRLRSRHQQTLLVHLLAGESGVAIAKKLRVSREAIRRRQQRLIEELRWQLASRDVI
jgi:RNA polymerase sigma factor (sigma-70 family)